MKAISYDHFGPVDVLHMAESAVPVAGRGQILVAVRSSSVNVLDSRVRNGQMGILVNKKFPKIPGADFSGVVAALGEGVTGLKVGDAVYGAADPFKGGAFAEFVAVPADQAALKPAALSFEQAAALPITALAALLSLRDLGAVKADDCVLIHGASGAVGLYATQMAKAMGAKVTAVAGTAGVAALKALGADEVIDYQKPGESALRGSFDVIINASGKMPYASGKRLLKANGRLIEPSPTIPVFIGSKIANLFRSKKHLVLQTFPRRRDLDALSAMIAKGQLQTSIAATYPLIDAAQATRALEKGGVVGKIVVTIDGAASH